MCRTKPICLALALFGISLVWMGEVRLFAGEFKIINRSNDRIYVVLHYWDSSSGQGLAGATQLGVVDYSEYWKTNGWYTVAPGQTQVVYSGNRDQIYVRMTRGSGISGKVIVPRSYFGKTSQFVHGNAFTITRDDQRKEDQQYFFMGDDGRGEATFRGSASQLRKICKPVGGFYLVNSSTTFTINPGLPAPPAPPRPAAPQPGPPNVAPAGMLWRGVYHSQYGRLELRHVGGNIIEGYMNYPSGGAGRLRGQIVNGRLRFDWWNDRDRGHGELSMLPGGRRLSGWFVAREGRRGWQLSK